MRGDSSYAVLGLRPGAPRAEIDLAYRRLIKRYHPDHPGGDAGRAAEVNQAYTELRSLSRQPQPQRAPPPPAGRPRQLPARRGPRWIGPVLALAAMGGGVLLAQSAGLMEPSGPTWPQVSSTGVPILAEGDAAREALVFSLDDPISTRMIEQSIDNAIGMDVVSNPAVAAQFSRDCLSRLGSSPSLPLFDACAAYDEAVAILAAGHPALESGPFNPLAVTARQVGAARLLSADHVESEARLQQIRSRVHLLLLPKIAEGAARPVNAVPAPPPPTEPPVVAYAEPTPAQPRVRASSVPRRPRAFSAPPQRRVRSVASVQRRPAPVVRSSPPPQAAAPGQTPAWQKPMKPAWQRPLPATPS